jgi:hypothetical protein
VREPSRRAVLAAGAALAAALLPAAAAAPAALGLRRGMNLWPWFSLTREFPAPRTDYDWPPYQPERPVPRREDLAALRRAGIDFVRIPVDPGPLIAFTGERHARLIDAVAEAVAAALAADLSVIVNLHPNNATHYWTAENFLRDRDDPLFQRYLALVAATAGRLARHDPARVGFEPLNEPPQDCGADLWPALQAEMVTAARAAAPDLTLILSGACGSMIAGLEALDPHAISDRNVIFTFHFYEPYVFSHQGAPWMTAEPMYRYLNAVPWPASAGSRASALAAAAGRLAADTATPSAEKRRIFGMIEQALTDYFNGAPDRSYIDAFFARVAAWGRRHGIAPGRILLGEFGALRSDARYVAARPADRARYIRDVREAAEALGLPWAFWNFFDSMGFTRDDLSRRFDPAILEALGLTSVGDSDKFR